MKIAFVCNDKGNIPWVFGKEHEKLAGGVFSKEEVLQGTDDFTDTEYIFSTWGMPSFTEEEVRRVFPSLKCVFYAAGTVQGFAREFLSCGVRVFSAWAANAVPVAEYTVAQIILANKGFFQSSREASVGRRAEASEIFSHYPGNYGATVGIIGAGMIGSLVIKMLKDYNLRVIVFDPFLSDAAASALQVEKVSLDELFAESNVVSNHLANNADTQGMLNKALFDKMRPYSTFLNTGRGAQVVEADLIDFLKERPDITAVLDVTFPEPPCADSELYSLSNCILTPHIAGSSGAEVRRMGEYMMAEYFAFISGKSTKYEVTFEMLERMA